MADAFPLITVHVEAKYLAHQSLPEQEHYLFAYTITITNQGHEPAKLLSRHWHITNGNGQTSIVNGPGVVGQQPKLAPGEHFTYTSSAVIETAVGSMHGHFGFQAQNGLLFDVEIPVFRLACPQMLH